jgi:glutaryl-CoA dehydrogenase
MLNYYAVDYSAEERLTQQTIRDFVDREVVGLLPAAFEEGRFPIELVPRLAELGVFGADIPQYGAGASYTQ